MKRVAALLLITLSLAGCASWFGGQEQPDPEIHLRQVETVKARLTEQQFILHFRIDNPRDEELTVRSLTYTVRLNDMLLAEGEADLWFSVPAGGRKNFEVPVRTNLWKHLKPLAKALKAHDTPLRYRLEGELITGLFFSDSLHLSRSGEIIPGDLFPE